MSDKVAKLLQDPKTAREFVSELLKSRAVSDQPSVTVRTGNQVTRYKSVMAIQRSKRG